MLEIKRYKQEDLNKSYDPNARKANVAAGAMKAQQNRDRQETLKIRREAQSAAERKPREAGKPKSGSDRFERAKTERVQQTDRSIKTEDKKQKRTQLTKPGT